MIQYFKPKYNKQNRDFPRNKTPIRTLLIDKGYSNIQIELISYDDTVLLSDNISSSNKHNINITIWTVLILSETGLLESGSIA